MMCNQGMWNQGGRGCGIKGVGDAQPRESGMWVGDAQPRGSGMRNQGGRKCAAKGVGDAQPRESGMRRHNQGDRGCATKQVAPVFVAIVVVLAVDQFIFCDV